MLHLMSTQRNKYLVDSTLVINKNMSKKQGSVKRHASILCLEIHLSLSSRSVVIMEFMMIIKMLDLLLHHHDGHHPHHHGHHDGDQDVGPAPPPNRGNERGESSSACHVVDEEVHTE